ncbi:hypothetical protein BJV78DRAFT_1237995, partial [Lactifluus subvellereus]
RRLHSFTSHSVLDGTAPAGWNYPPAPPNLPLGVPRRSSVLCTQPLGWLLRDASVGKPRLSRLVAVSMWIQMFVCCLQPVQYSRRIELLLTVLAISPPLKPTRQTECTLLSANLKWQFPPRSRSSPQRDFAHLLS